MKTWSGKGWGTCDLGHRFGPAPCKLAWYLPYLTHEWVCIVSPSLLTFICEEGTVMIHISIFRSMLMWCPCLRYFIVKSCNRENLELSVQQGVWATQRSNEAKLNEAFDSVENVILVFSINRTRHFQVLYFSPIRWSFYVKSVTDDLAIHSLIVTYVVGKEEYVIFVENERNVSLNLGLVDRI